MIAKISGTIVHILGSSVIVEVAGVGYEVFPTSRELLGLTESSIVSFFIAENIKEDEHSLYGFLSLEARSLYYQLISVQGVGPKAALAILSAYTPSEISRAIEEETITTFSAVSGIGSKTAQRILLDLKGKLVAVPGTQKLDPAFQALVSLGYSAQDAKRALENITATDTQQRVREALKGVQK